MTQRLFRPLSASGFEALGEPHSGRKDIPSNPIFLLHMEPGWRKSNGPKYVRGIDSAARTLFGYTVEVKQWAFYPTGIVLVTKNIPATAFYFDDVDRRLQGVAVVNQKLPIRYNDSGPVFSDEPEHVEDTQEVKDIMPREKKVVEEAQPTTPGGKPDRIDVVCTHSDCSNEFNTIVHYNDDGTVNRSRTQARCSRCRRKNTAYVVQALDGVTPTRGRKAGTKSTKEPAKPRTPKKPELQIDGVPDKKKVQVEKNTVGKKVEPQEPQARTEASPTVPAEMPIVAITSMDITPFLDIIHTIESDILKATRPTGEGLTTEQITLLSQCGNQSFDTICQRYPRLSQSPLVPLVMYLLAQVTIIFGPMMVGKLVAYWNEKKAEIEKAKSEKEKGKE